jgi:hypothetical protein
MPKPVLQSLILADHVYEDKLTGKRIIAGVFNRIIRGVKVIKQMGPPMPAPMPQAPAPFVQTILPGQAIPQTPATQAPTFQAPASQPSPSSGPGIVSQPAPYQQPPPGYTPPASQPAPMAAPAPASPSAPASPPAHAAPPSQPAAPVQPSAPAQPSAPIQQTPPPAPAYPAYPTGQMGPPGTPLQPGQRVLEIPPTGLQSGSPFAYLSLTEIRGPNSFVLQLVNLAEDTQLFRSDLRVDCPDPLLTVEMTVPLPPISPTNAGIYALELLHNNEILGSLRIIVEDAAQ